MGVHARQSVTHQLIRAILRGLVNHYRSGNSPLYWMCSTDSGLTVEEPEVVPDLSVWRTSSKTHFTDDVTGFPLEPALVHAARHTEMDFLQKLVTWSEFRLRSELPAGTVVFGVRWVDTNRGDFEVPDNRSRLVVQETRR